MRSILVEDDEDKDFRHYYSKMYLIQLDLFPGEGSERQVSDQMKVSTLQMIHEAMAWVVYPR